jgi:rhamnosyltransferase
VPGVVTVAIPVRDGGEALERTLAAVRAQRLDELGVGLELELLVCDSGSRDGSVAIARAAGAEVLAIEPGDFSHGATRNLLVERSRGTHVAFLTQDAEPEGERWLAELLGGFDAAAGVALTFGPYRPRPGVSPMVARELTEWFRSFAPDGDTRVDRLGPGERGIAPRELLGPRGFFTDANGAVSRAAWEQVRFRPVAYAEDHVLAHDMLRAGYAKAFVPAAGVIHSHDYGPWDWLRRSFDEARALHEVYGYIEPGGRRAALNVWGRVGADRRWQRDQGQPATPLLPRAAAHHALRAAGAVLGSRAERLPRGLAERLSLEGRAR